LQILVLAKQQRCHFATKVTVGVLPHFPCITDLGRVAFQDRSCQLHL